MPRRIGVVGPGAIGGLLAARLSKAGHEVTVIATERTAVRLSSQALTLQTPHKQLETRPIARPWLTAPVEVLFVTTRATDLPAALERVPPALLTASISPYAQAEVCAAALTLRMGAAFAIRPASFQSPCELSATISRS
jgi:2-dehydropantoate 2-reductase